MTVANTPYGSSQASASNVAIRIEWNSAKDIANNTITYTFNIVFQNNTSTQQTRYGRYTVNFNSVYTGSYDIFDYFGIKKVLPANYNGVVYSKSYTVPSNNFNETGTVKDSARFVVSVGISTSKDGSYNSVALDTIYPVSMDRKSYPTLSSSAGALKDTLTINTNRKASAFTHNIYGRITNQSSYDTLATSVGTNTQYTIPESYATYVPNQSSARYEIKCETHDASGNTVGSASTYYDLNLLTDSLKPNITSVALTDDAKMSDNATTYLQKFGAFVYGKSKVTATLTEQYMYNATFVSRGVNLGNTTLASNPATFSNIPSSSNNPTLNATILDSRGNSASYSTSIEVLDYSAPKFSSTPEVFRSNSSGTIKPDDGTYVAIKATWSKSTLTRNGTAQNFVRMRIYKNDSLIHDSGSLTADSSYNGTKIVVSELDTLASSEIKVVLTDTAESNAEYEVTVAPVSRVMSFKADKTGVAIGKPADKAGFEVQWDTYINEDLAVTGSTSVGGNLNVAGSISGGLNTTTANLFNSITGNSGSVSLDTVLTALLNNLPKVGDYWTTESSETPATHFGFGTWIKITDMMLVGAGNSYSVGDQGGSKDAVPILHNHTISNLAHDHVSSEYQSYHIITSGSGSKRTGPFGVGSGHTGQIRTGAADWNAAPTISTAGSTGTNLNMPPYRAVNIWRRTA